MRQTSLIAFLVLVLCSYDAQTLHSQSTFQKVYISDDGSQANDVIPLSQGGYAIAGWYDVQGLFSAEFYLVVIEATGDTLWTRTYGKQIDTSSFVQNGSGNEGYQITQTQDGGFLFVGERHEIAGGTSDAYLVRTDAQGELMWARMYGGDDNEYAIGAVQDAKGNFIIGGFTETFGAGIRDMFLFKVTEGGDTLWTRTYGGESIDAAIEMKSTSDGGFIMTGYTFSFGAGSSDVYVIRTDSSGQVLWQKTFGGTLNDIGHAIVETADGGFVIAGETESFGVGNRDIYLLRINADGDLQWSFAYGGMDYEAANAVTLSQNGDIAIAGYTRGDGAGAEDFLLLLTDDKGEMKWARTYGGPEDETAKAIITTPDDGFLMTGYARSFSTGGLDVYLVRTDSMGISGCDQTVESFSTQNITTTEDTPASVISYGTVIKQRPTLSGRTNTTVSDPCAILNTDSGEGIEEPFSIYPNPANDVLYINSPQASITGTCMVNLFDTFGRRVLHRRIDAGDDTIALTSLPPGVYVVSIFNGRETFARTIVIL